MAADQEPQTRTEHPEASPSAESPRPARRSGRGRRGRGRRRKQKPVETQPTPPGSHEATSAEEIEASQDEGAEFSEHEEVSEPEPLAAESPMSFQESEAQPVPEPRPEPRHAVEAAPRSEPASRLTIQKAIDDVNQIVASLKETQELMDEVLEMLEDFERQGNADEREIESLRRALRHLQRPRDGGQHHPRGRH